MFSNSKLNFIAEERIPLTVASPGLVLGKAYRYAFIPHKINEVSSLGAEAECKLLNSALSQAGSAIKAEMAKVNKEISEILATHLSFIEDPLLKEAAYSLIKQNKTATFAWHKVTASEANKLAGSNNSYLAARASDLHDIGQRVLNILLGQNVKVSYPKNSIVITQDVTPSMVIGFTPEVLAVVSVLGSPVSHASIMLQNMGITALYDAPEQLLQLPNGTPLIADGNAGLLVINAGKTTQESYTQSVSGQQNR